MFWEILSLANASACVGAAALCGLSPSSCPSVLRAVFGTLGAWLCIDALRCIHAGLWSHLAHHVFFVSMLQLPRDPRLHWYYSMLLLHEASTIPLNLMAIEKELWGKASVATRACFGALFLATRVVLFWFMFLVSLGDVPAPLSVAALIPGALNLYWLRCIHTKSGLSVPFGWLCAASVSTSVALYATDLSALLSCVLVSPCFAARTVSPSGTMPS